MSEVHPGPWRIEHPEHLTAPLLIAADGTELYYLERVSATGADDALVAQAPTLRTALEQLDHAAREWRQANDDEWVPGAYFEAQEHFETALEVARAALAAAGAGADDA